VLAVLICILALSLACSAAALAQEDRPLITTPTPQPTPTPTIMPVREAWAERSPLLGLTPEAQRRGGLIFFPLAIQHAGGRALDVTPESFSYIVQPGDTLWSLALDFGRDLDTMSCATTPTGADAEALVPGQTITVPALRDLCYTVTPGDALAGIATRHGLTVEAIAAIPWNGFTSPPYTVRPKQRVLLPGARPAAAIRADHHAVSYASDAWAKTAYPDWPFGDGQFVWPVIGPISQAAHPGHRALDIAVPVGTPVKAADRGTVLMAGWNPSGYGFRVVIDHGNDYVTLYAHLSDIYVEPGQVVGKGQVIGASGANGNVTGPHLHFEIRDFGALTDPWTLLPK
jgi:LysM repeat protein